VTAAVWTGSGDFKGGEMGKSRTERGDLSLLEPEDERRPGLKMDRFESLESRWLVRDLFVAMLPCRGDKGGWTVGCSGKDGYWLAVVGSGNRGDAMGEAIGVVVLSSITGEL
jgi:hypothetical protein